MTITNTQQVIDYMQLLALSHKDIADFTLFEQEVKGARQRSTSQYPIIELEYPQAQIVVNTSGNTAKVYNLRFSLLEYCEKDDWQLQQDIICKLEAILDSIVARMADDDVIDIPHEGQQLYNLYPIRNFEADNLFGWAVELTLRAPQSFCLEEELWNEAALCRPEFVPGDGNLSIDVNETLIFTPWTSKAFPPLQKIADAINELVAGVQADVFAGTLRLRAKTQGDTVIADSVDGGHSWQIVTL
jgi:hypothetical protein